MDHGQQLKISGWQMAGIKFVSSFVFYSLLYTPLLVYLYTTQEIFHIY
jgi:hypothetical protein